MSLELQRLLRVVPGASLSEAPNDEADGPAVRPPRVKRKPKDRAGEVVSQSFMEAREAHLNLHLFSHPEDARLFNEGPAVLTGVPEESPGWGKAATHLDNNRRNEILARVDIEAGLATSLRHVSLAEVSKELAARKRKAQKPGPRPQAPQPKKVKVPKGPEQVPQIPRPVPGGIPPAQRWIALKSKYKGVGLFHKPRTREERSFRREFDGLKRSYGSEGSLPHLKLHPADSARRRQGSKLPLRKLLAVLTAVATSAERKSAA
jgi:hypothetical protein